MRELVLKMSMSLDGFVASAQPDSDWMFRGSSPDSAAWVLDTISGAGTHAVGRRLFESWIGFWPESDNAMAVPINAIPKVVFTRQSGYDPAALIKEGSSSAHSASWGMSRVAAGDLGAAVQGLKMESGEYILAQGGLEFGRSLVQSGLVDEYRFVVLPVALGTGETLFPTLSRGSDLELISSTAFRGGVLGNVYRPVK